MITVSPLPDATHVYQYENDDNNGDPMTLDASPRLPEVGPQHYLASQKSASFFGNESREDLNKDSPLKADQRSNLENLIDI